MSHRFTPWKYDRHRRRWCRHCTVGWACAAVESVPRGMKPKGGK